MNTKTEIDFEKIIDEYCNAFLERKCVLLAMKEAVKQARDISLREAAEKCEAVTDEVDIKFAEWCLEHIYNTEHPIDMVNKLKLFKQENGL